MTSANTGNPTLDWYTRFADNTSPEQSPLYREWAAGIISDPAVLTLLDELPRPKRQPHLVFAVSRLLGAPEGPYAKWRTWLLANWSQLKAEASVRFTQTNEPLRAAPLLAALSLIDGPIALLEVGASAGLCLYPDHYSYTFNDLRLDPATGESPVLLHCTTTGMAPVALTIPRIVWRAGIDLAPVDVLDPTDLRWLEVSVGPEQQERRDRLKAAASIVRADPPRLVAGDATAELARLAAEAPADATLVVVSFGVLVYLAVEDRARFTRAVEALDARWVSLEAAAVLPEVQRRLGPATAPAPGLFPLALDQQPLAWCGPHGQSIAWLESAR